MSAFLDPISYLIEAQPEPEPQPNIIDSYLDILEEYYYYLYLYTFLHLTE
jgi:hypothetical protein